MLRPCVFLSVRLSQDDVLSKWLNVYIAMQMTSTIALGFYIYESKDVDKIPVRSPLTGTPNTHMGVGKICQKSPELVSIFIPMPAVLAAVM